MTHQEFVNKIGSESAKKLYAFMILPEKMA